MNMDYEPMWRVVDAHRRCADELERTLRELTGDQPAPEGDDIAQRMAEWDALDERDDIELYNVIKEVLENARDQLYVMADREGHTVRRRDSSRCRVFASRCNRVINTMWKECNK